MEDKKISEAVELLFKGAKMLAYHCPECKMPLFKYKGRTFCPSCKRDAEIIEKDGEVLVELKKKEEVKEEEKEKMELIKKDRAVSEIKYDIKYDEIDKILINCVMRLVGRIDKSEELEEIERIVCLIDKILIIIDKLKKTLRKVG